MRNSRRCKAIQFLIPTEIAPFETVLLLSGQSEVNLRKDIPGRAQQQGLRNYISAAVFFNLIS